MPMQVRIREHSPLAGIGARILKESAVALTWGHHIHLHRVSRQDFLNNKQWVCHEIVHVHQYRKYGLLSFTFLYLWESLRKGYYRNRWEVEARARQNNLQLLEDVIFV